MKKRLLSVVVPVFNLEEYIEECIESIRNQTYENIEIIIIDDGSTDKTPEMCKALAGIDDRIIYFYQNNAGVTAARTKGVELAHGEYITFVDGDDYIEPNMYENMMSYMINGSDMIACGMKYYKTIGCYEEVCENFDGTLSGKSEMEYLWSHMIYDSSKYNICPLHPSVCNKIFIKELICNILQKLDSSIFYGEDAVWTYLYVLQCQRISFIKETFYNYRYRENSVVHSKNEKMLENINKVYMVLKSVFQQHSMRDSLKNQLEKWVIIKVANTINKYMGFSKENRIPQYVIPIDDLWDKKVVLYGAGVMGQDIMWQYQKEQKEPYLWVDRENEHYRKLSMNVQGIDVLRDKQLIENIDYVLIAISNEKIAENVRKNLESMDIPSNIILWKKPIQIY